MDDAFSIEDSYDTRKRGRALDAPDQQSAKRISFVMPAPDVTDDHVALDSNNDSIKADGKVYKDKVNDLKVTVDGSLPLEYVYRNLPTYLIGIKPGHYLLKILVPSNVAGSIIGKGGVQIKELQTNYEVSIKLSQSNHYYPESNKMSNERIVLVQGVLDRLVQVAEYIQSLVRDPPMDRASDIMAVENSRRKSQMKIVVTNTTAGMIIGKGGETIKSLNERYDVRIQLSQKDEVVLGERVVTITGEPDGINRVVEFIVKEKIRDDPTANSLSNLDYSTYIDSVNQGGQGGMGAAGNPYSSYNDGTDMGNVGILNSLLSSGGGQQQNSYNSYLPQQQSQAFSSLASNQSLGGQNVNGTNAEVLAQVLSQLNSSTLASALVQALSGNGGNPVAPGNPDSSQPSSNQGPPRQQLRAFISRPDDVKYRIAIPDNIVGRVLGRMGCTITEIQNTTGCEVKFSQRGEYMPGTQNRILYISGQNSACQTAQQMVLQKIEGEAKDINTSDFTFEQIPI